jgi:N-acetyl-anhydromuramyl-L-alanine amidase AmpD
MNLRRIIVIHATCGATGQSSIDGWRAKGDGICTHLVIERDGTILQTRPFNRTCGHVRDVCRWGSFSRLNSQSIGIELANAENDRGAYSWAKRQPNFKDADGDGFEDYPQAQLDSVFEVSKLIVARYNLDDVVSHASLDPSRRDDPGPEFHMEDFRARLGFVS